MNDDQVSITALVCGFTRAYHATHDSPKIFDDFLADRLFTTEEKAFFGKNVNSLLDLYEPGAAAGMPDEAAVLRRVMQVYNSSTILSRARFTEDCLDEALNKGLNQYVILGAGLDTFALRRPDLAGRLQVFEVDHPATQANKLERMQRISPELPPNLHLVPVNFAKDDLKSALLQAGYNPDRAGFFSWLGVTYYLELDTIRSTLRLLSALCAPGSSLVIDYADPGAFQVGKSTGRDRAMQTITRHSGEPMKTGFEPVLLEEILNEYGFETRENLSPEDIEKRYFSNRHDLYHAFEYAHFIRAVKS